MHTSWNGFARKDDFAGDKSQHSCPDKLWETQSFYIDFYRNCLHASKFNSKVEYVVLFCSIVYVFLLPYRDQDFTHAWFLHDSKDEEKWK